MTDLILSLQITALGMGLVFGTIILLWLMMMLLTRLTAEGQPAADLPGSELSSTTDLKQQAAALAVALALTEQELSSAHPLAQPPTALVSAWQLGMRTRQMSEKGHMRRHVKE
jgi:Na+-transporting methylmalonyl-CoA/oxaloacetate decarboxylase gamma subunit